MHSLITQLDNAPSDMQAVSQHLTQIRQDLNRVPGFVHFRLVRHRQHANTYLLLTFWATRRHAMVNKARIKEIIGRV